MEAPPQPPPPSISAPMTTPTSESLNSSPRSKEPCPAPPSKIRLMCSYGGHIVPRPHDKALCYIGGDTRIIVIDRNTSLSDLHQRLSKTLLHNQSFILKYQLPNEDLDSLISVATDEDFENMVDEYDRLNFGGGGSKPPSRLRFFLFPKSPTNSIEHLVETGSTKSEEWFFEALNGKVTNLSTSERGFSESSSVNCLLGLDDDFSAKGNVVGKNVEGSKNCGSGNERGIFNQDVHSVPDSPMPENSSSFGSTSSYPSVAANLPHIKVRVEENPKVGIGEQIQQINVGNLGNNVNVPVVQKQEEVAGGFTVVGPMVSGLPVVVGGDYANRVISDDERSDHSGYRLVQQVQPQAQLHLQQQQQQIPQMQQRQASTMDFPSPDSVLSEGSIANPLSRQGQAIYQEPFIQIQQSRNIQVPANQIDQSYINKVQMQPQVQESSYMFSGQYDQNNLQLQRQQFVHNGTKYIPAGPVPIQPYYIYPPGQQHQVYYMPVRQTQAYNSPHQQPSYADVAPTGPTSQPQTPPSAATIAPHASQHQTQYVGLTQFHHPSQSMVPFPAHNPSYNYEFADPKQQQVYYNQALSPQMAAPYQTMGPAPTMVLPDASAQLLPTENIKQQVSREHQAAS